ncbi:MAG TPA: ferric reductase-like transmembrane domain-containing protein [Allosphingosinicella sp.]|nr:ferric reductase-like transmembrane domain-containing protein [Allosphingosinicella sp.]
MAAPIRSLLNSRAFLWALLALPAAHILYRFAAQDVWPDELVGPSGIWAARLILLALMLTPLAALLPRARPVSWLLRRRRAFGVAAFCYALLHLAFYIAEMETPANVLAEFELPGIWTGWAALLLMLPLALTSNDASVRMLKRGWKKLHRLAYPAALLILAHWIIVHNALIEALVTFAPLALLEAWRLARLFGSRRSLRSPA